MEYAEHRFTLNLHSALSHTSLAIKKGDTKHRLIISLAEGGEPYAIADGCMAVFLALKPDNTTIFDSCSIEDNRVIYDVSPQTVAAGGMVMCEVRIYGPEQGLLSSESFVILVDDSGDRYEEGIPSTDEFNALTETLSKAVEIFEAWEKLKGNESLMNFADALDVYARQGGGVGLPLIHEGGVESFSMMTVIGPGNSIPSGNIDVPCVEKVQELIKEESEYIDVTAAYEAALAGKKVSCAKEFLWTLGVGRWHLAEMFPDGDIDRSYYLHVILGENGLKHRILVKGQDFCYVEFYNDGQYDEKPFIEIDGDVGYIYSNGKLCSPTDLTVKNGKVYLAKDGFAFGEGVLLPSGSGFVKSVNGQAPDENGNVEIDIPEGGNSSPGNDGKDGGYYVPTVEQVNENEVEISFTSQGGENMPHVDPVTMILPRGADGEKGDKGDKGDQGEQGPKGDTGATGPQGEPGATGEQGIPGEKGEKGNKGDKGDPGNDGKNGVDGTDGTSPTVSVSAIASGHRITITDAEGEKTLDVLDGVNGKDGTDGQPGKDGQDGKTPVLGVDYFTETDKAEIVSRVIDHFGGLPIVGVVDNDNHIVLSSTLPVGTYTLKYEGTDGLFSDIVDLTITDEDKIPYINVLPLAQAYGSTSPYVGADGSIGYGNDMRVSTSSASATYMKAQTGVDATALIPVKRGDVIRFKNCNFKVTPSNTSYGSMIYGFDSSKAVVSSFNATHSSMANRFPRVVQGNEIVQITIEPLASWENSNVDSVAFVMITTDGLDESSIITINQEIV